MVHLDTVNISNTHEGFVRKPKAFNNYMMKSEVFITLTDHPV